MIDIEEITRRLAHNAEAIHALVGSISDEQALWKPDPDTWSLKEVMEHVYNEERIDFRMHLQEILSDPPQPWGSFNREGYAKVETLGQALESFLTEREASLAWLKALQSPDWAATIQAAFGPSEVLVLSAGDVLVSWVAHDFLHLRQVNELLFAWNQHRASPYSVRYAGEW